MRIRLHAALPVRDPVPSARPAAERVSGDRRNTGEPPRSRRFSRRGIGAAVRLLGTALVLVFGASVLHAEAPGQADARFQAALDAWLADDDQGALPALADLAVADNRAAQVLLALIDVMPETQGPWLAAQSREARIALLRQPGGLSGRSWMARAAADAPLARLWLRRWDAMAGDEAATAMAFATLGERRAARETLIAMHARQRGGFAAIADDPLYPPELRRLVWLEWADDPAMADRAASEIAALAPGDPQRVAFADIAPDPAARDDWLAEAPLAAPLRAFCTAACADTAPDCLRATLALLGGTPGLLLFGAPSETLVPPEVWTHSPRGRAAILRRAAALNPGTAAATRAAVAAEDACAASALEAEAARFAR